MRVSPQKLSLFVLLDRKRPQQSFDLEIVGLGPVMDSLDDIGCEQGQAKRLAEIGLVDAFDQKPDDAPARPGRVHPKAASGTRRADFRGLREILAVHGKAGPCQCFSLASVSVEGAFHRVNAALQ